MLQGAASRPQGKFKLLDKDGIACVGEVIQPGDVYINKQSPINTRDPVANPSAPPRAPPLPPPSYFALHMGLGFGFRARRDVVVATWHAGRRMR